MESLVTYPKGTKPLPRPEPDFLGLVYDEKSVIPLSSYPKYQTVFVVGGTEPLRKILSKKKITNYKFITSLEEITLPRAAPAKPTIDELVLSVYKVPGYEHITRPLEKGRSYGKITSSDAKAILNKEWTVKKFNGATKLRVKGMKGEAAKGIRTFIGKSRKVQKAFNAPFLKTVAPERKVLRDAVKYVIVGPRGCEKSTMIRSSPEMTELSWDSNVVPEDALHGFAQVAFATSPDTYAINSVSADRYRSYTLAVQKAFLAEFTNPSSKKLYFFFQCAVDATSVPTASAKTLLLVDAQALPHARNRAVVKNEGFSPEDESALAAYISTLNAVCFGLTDNIPTITRGQGPIPEDVVPDSLLRSSLNAWTLGSTPSASA